MIYRSNLECPDLQPHFKHVTCRTMPHSKGHSVLSDWADKKDDDPRFRIYKRCGFWTHDEAAILYNCVKPHGGRWVDIGSHTGWTTAHIAAAGASEVIAIDHIYPPRCACDDFRRRFWENIRAAGLQNNVMTWGDLSAKAMRSVDMGMIDGAVIDGDHDAPHPTQDAQACVARLNPNGVILFHDYNGQPVKEAATWLCQNGFQRREYRTPHGVCVCWRGDFDPPDHIPDPNLR